MAITPKSWTADDVQMDKLTINKVVEGSTTYVVLERRYSFIDDSGNVLDQISGGRVVETVAWSSIPANIRTALQDIDTWTKNKALAQEGMGSE